MDRTKLESVPAYAIDTYTNHFLAAYPVHCELRTVPLDMQLLHSHNGYEFYFVFQGSGSYIVGDILYPLHAGTLTVVHPNVIHRPFHVLNKEFHRYVLSIDESYLDKLHTICHPSDLSIQRLLKEVHPDSSHYFLTVQQLNQLQTLMFELERSLRLKEPHFELNVLKGISEFFLLLLSLQGDPTAIRPVKSEDEQIVGDVLSYLITHHQEELYIDDLLARFPVSRSRLFNLFKETTGITIKQFLTEYRLNKAKRLLAETDLAITEITAATGFGDISHFFNVFKKGTTLTPNQYRKEAVKRQLGNPADAKLPDSNLN
ncbi:hypothetical protein BC351_24185 [Paenibacillus ferrarius]|uniref:HTH araC/xylS-type domain-containing protein n=1 Tax=Paenibacillus ferrarius TaxID=1469647 RepID=A0A1V4HLU2_9BACL|nr:AraC family transcriptional regulator [Paenibacillus ferrarius]OPH58449.1 hypothetical protein BC351_24185 [Paenibacillus ferrarius]